jgi:hypothetical protein
MLQPGVTSPVTSQRRLEVEEPDNQEADPRARDLALVVSEEEALRREFTQILGT